MSAIITLALVSCPPNIEINRKFCMKSCDQAFPDPTFKEGKGLMTFERFLGSCKLSNLTFAKANQIAALRFSCDLATCHTATIIQCQLAI